jgi:hypothetical protein
MEGKLRLTVKEFETCTWVIRVDNTGYYNEEEARNSLKKKEIIGDISLQIQLMGFKKAGVEAFPVFDDVYIDLQEYYYSIGADRNPGNKWMKQLYHQPVTQKELNQISEKFCESIYDNINRQLNRITENK